MAEEQARNIATDGDRWTQMGNRRTKNVKCKKTSYRLTPYALCIPICVHRSSSVAIFRVFSVAACMVAVLSHNFDCMAEIEGRRWARPTTLPSHQVNGRGND